MRSGVTSSTNDGLIRFEIDQAVMRTIERALGDMKSQSRKVLKTAVNDTAKQAKADLAKKAKEVYSVKKSPFTKAMDTKKATASNPTATINVTGQQLELIDFRSTANAEGVAAKVLKKGRLKSIQSQRGHKAKAFVATFSSGHITIVQRQEGETYRRDAQKRREKYGKWADMTRIKKLLSNSIPKMIGSQENVYGIVEPKIYEHLMEAIQREVNKVLSKRK